MFTQEEIIKAYGPFTPGNIEDRNYMESCMYEIEQFPRTLRSFFEKLDYQHQDACYREGSWTFRQVVHHLADSHMQAFQRFKLALTEDNPTIKPYIQNAWASTNDSVMSDIRPSLAILEGLHERWMCMLRQMQMEDFQKTFYHPESQKEFKLGVALALYAWHGKHHYTQMYRYASNNHWI